MQCANCGHDNPDNNKFCGECGQLLNDPHDVGRFSVMQSRANDADALSASLEGVENDNAPFPHQERVPREYFDQWKPIEPERHETPHVSPVAHVPEPVGAERPAYAGRSNDSSILGVSDPEPVRPSNGFLSMEPEQRESTPLHGPSFLGLGDPSPEYTYTYEDPKPPRTRMWLALGILVVLVVLGALQWRAIGQGLRYSKEGILRITLPLRNRASQQATNQQPTEQQQSEQQQGDQAAATGDQPQMVVEEPKPPAKDEENPPATAESGNAAASSDGSAAKTAGATPTTGATSGAATAGGAASAAETQPPAAKSESNAAADGTHAQTTEDTAAPQKPVETASAKPPKPAARREAAREVHQPEPPAGGEAELQSALAAGDPKVEASLLWKAVGKGNVDAQVRLADMYANGVGVPQSCDQAMVLMRSASAKSSVRARVKMGAMYATGKCVGQDRVAAYRWMGRALELDPGSDWVRQNRESLWAQMSPDERTRAGGR